MIAFPKEDSTRLIDTGVQGMRFHQTQQLLMEWLIVTRRLPIQDDKISLQAVQPPIGVGDE